MLKNAKDACATEALEIATYTALERLARSVGDRETATLAAAIRADEERMLERLMAELPKLAEAVVAADVKGNGSYDVTTTGAADSVRKAARRPARPPRRAPRRPSAAPARRARSRAPRAPRAPSRARSPASRTCRSPATTSSTRTRSRPSWPSSRRSTSRRSTPTSASTRTAPRSPAGSAPCAATSRGRDTTSRASRRSARRSDADDDRDEEDARVRARAQGPRRRPRDDRARAQQRLAAPTHHLSLLSPAGPPRVGR